MKKSLWFLTIFTFHVWAEEAPRPNIFDPTPESHVFAEQSLLEQYLRDQKPSTFKYYQRLDATAQKQVFEAHRNDQDKDITELVLVVYRRNR